MNFTGKGKQLYWDNPDQEHKYHIFYLICGSLLWSFRFVCLTWSICISQEPKKGLLKWEIPAGGRTEHCMKGLKGGRFKWGEGCNGVAEQDMGRVTLSMLEKDIWKHRSFLRQKTCQTYLCLVNTYIYMHMYICVSYVPHARCGILPFKLLFTRIFSKTLKIIQDIAHQNVKANPCCWRHPTFWSWDVDEANQHWSGSFLPIWMAFVVPEGATLASGRKRHQRSYPPVDPMSYNSNQRGKMDSTLAWVLKG